MPLKTRQKVGKNITRSKPSVLDDETYPADMEEARAEPDNLGDDKPGPKNPASIPNPEG